MFIKEKQLYLRAGWPCAAKANHRRVCVCVCVSQHMIMLHYAFDGVLFLKC